ncbi:hypothetical protein PN502_04210 [Microcystis aeruginosa CS-338/01]|uniref:hypothetical protein n=1 Tax=Microcystis aeruginosa TaxID=1126 RepID=UPI002330824F|nr:hypothetical protein [Microcystis aeruginosa]MDB9506312.1 hypothetical protein [Microcystis aeruginosa CS-338/01]
MPELIIHAIDCKVVSSGTDAGAIQAVVDTVKKVADVGAGSTSFFGPTGAAVGAALQAAKALISVVPGLISAIDIARNDPDQLYLNLSNQERAAKVWPPGKYYNINGGQIVRPNLRVPFSDAVDVNFWEYDTGSGDDFLGRLTVDKSHAGGVRYQIVAMPSEGNVYVVAYSIEGVPIPSPGGSTSGGGWETLGGHLTSGPDVCSWAPGRLDVFVRGGDDALYHRYFENSWSDWESLGGVLTSDPSAVSWGNGRIDVFARGGDNALYHKYFENGWSDWESLGGHLTSGPDVCSWAPGRLDVFVRGEDAALYHKYFENGWSDWESLGGVLTSDPSAVSWGNGRIDVFARGGDNALYHKYFENGWSDWESLGGVLTSSPDASSWAAGRLDIFVRGGDNALYHKYFENGWSDWESLGGILTSDPAAVSWNAGRIDVFARGGDYALYHKWFDGSWKP